VTQQKGLATRLVLFKQQWPLDPDDFVRVEEEQREPQKRIRPPIFLRLPTEDPISVDG